MGSTASPGRASVGAGGSARRSAWSPGVRLGWVWLAIVGLALAAAMVRSGAASGSTSASPEVAGSSDLSIGHSKVTAEATAPDLAVVLQSWAFVSIGEANVEAVWRVENHGVATDLSTRADFAFSTGGLTFVQPGPGDPPGCPDTFHGGHGCPVPPLAAGASWLITTRVHAADTSFFGLAMHIHVPGAPTVIDAHSVDNDAQLVVQPPPAGSGGSGGTPGATPRPPSLPVVELLLPHATFDTAPGKCRAVPALDQVLKLVYAGSSERTVTFPNGTSSNTWFPDQGLPVGVTSMAVTAFSIDNPPLPTTVTFTITIVDNQRPRIVPPRGWKTLVVDATSPAGAKVRYPVIRTVDNCAGVQVTGRPTSGATFPIGTKRVTLTATDISGNAATYTFDVTVRGAGEQFDDIRNAIGSLRGKGLHLAADATRIRRLLRDRHPGARACESLESLTTTIHSLSSKPTTRRRAAIVSRLAQVRSVVGC